MTDAARTHRCLAEALAEGRSTGRLTEAMEEQLLERMFDLWADMTPTEQDEARRNIAAGLRQARFIGSESD